MRYLISLFICSFYLYGFNYHLKPYNISEGVNCFFGLPSQVNDVNGGNMINSCYIETEDGYVVIDSGPTYTYAQEAYAVMKKKKNLAVKYVINTSWDEVHVLGNEFYKEMGAKLIGPKGYKKYLETKKELFLKTKLTKDAFINTRIIPLDQYIEKEEKLSFLKFDLRIKVLEKESNHLYVYIPKKDIVFAGDLIFNNRVVPLTEGRSLDGWLNEIAKLEKLKWSNIITGHGYMTRRSALKNTQSYLSLLRSEVFKRIEENQTREEIIENVELDDFKNIKLYDVWQTKNVTRAYDELIKIVVKKSKLKRLKVKDKNTTIVAKKEVAKKEVAKKEVAKKEVAKKEVAKKEVAKKEVAKKEILHIRYKTFKEAIASGKLEEKIVLIKVRSTVCKYCDQLEMIFTENPKVKRLLNKYFEVVVLNVDNDALPLDLIVRSTPTLIFVRPDNQKILMEIAGIRALGELLEILEEAIEDGHMGAYLKP